MKLDFFGSIEPDGCYFGRRRVLSIASFILFATILASVVTLILLFYLFITVYNCVGVLYIAWCTYRLLALKHRLWLAQQFACSSRN
jgi:hypothetical protein